MIHRTIDYSGDSDGEFVGAVYLHKNFGACSMGHAAIALVKDNGMMDVFSTGGVGWQLTNANGNESIKIILPDEKKIYI